MLCCRQKGGSQSSKWNSLAFDQKNVGPDPRCERQRKAGVEMLETLEMADWPGDEWIERHPRLLTRSPRSRSVELWSVHTRPDATPLKLFSQPLD